MQHDYHHPISKNPFYTIILFYFYDNKPNLIFYEQP
jgi:hypothetical protein